MKIFSYKFYSVFIVIVLIVIGDNALSKEHLPNHIMVSKGENGLPINDVKEVMESHTGALMDLPGVVGVYISALEDGSPCIKVMVVKKTSLLEEKIPKVLEGYPVIIVETGELVPYSDEKD